MTDIPRDYSAKGETVPKNDEHDDTMALDYFRSLLLAASRNADDSADVYVRVHGTSPCVSPAHVFCDEDGAIQILLPPNCKIGK